MDWDKGTYHPDSVGDAQFGRYDGLNVARRGDQVVCP